MKYLGYAGFIIGTFLCAFTTFVPVIENKNLIHKTKLQSQLTPVNEDKWTSIPGMYNYDIQWSHYLYSVANLADVLFSNAVPLFTKNGPYIYQESDNYTDLLYNSEENTVDSIFNQWTTYNASMPQDPSLNTTMWLPNMGSMATWWRQQNQEEWKTYMQVMYDVVNKWQGEYLRDLWVFTSMRYTYF